MSDQNKGFVPPTARPVWYKLQQHQQQMAQQHLRDMFVHDPERADRYTIRLDEFYLDYSKQLITDETLALLLELAVESELQKQIQDLFSGAIVNQSEQRPALHTALRQLSDHTLIVNNENVCTLIQHELQRMDNFITHLHAGTLTGSTGKPINTLVNIGIGGSDLGPRLVVDALTQYRHSGCTIHFAANIDPHELNTVLGQVSPETTLFVISSKSFTTEETLTNARIIKQWLADQDCTEISPHFAAVTANVAAAESFGILPEHIFRIWDWVGGRYSLWSATGLPIAAAIGMDNFRALLAGAQRMDQHFLSAPLIQNIPVILGLLDIWNINFFNARAQACIPYDQRLARLPDYLAQLFMESNGKHINQQNQAVDYSTGVIVWGGVGTNAQHAFMQLLHQGTQLIPVDLLAAASGTADENIEQRRSLLANCIGQSQALLQGDPQPTDTLYKSIPGNKPSTTLIYDQLTPHTLGMLLALYEHRTFVQAVIWNINPFDQWGVELGKKIAQGIKSELAGVNNNDTHDTSTQNLINHCSKIQIPVEK